MAGHASQEMLPTPPVLLDGNLEYEVEDILDVQAMAKAAIITMNS